MVRLHGSEGSGATLTMKPRSWRQSTITCVSSLHKAPEMTLSPSASAARTRTRLVMLLEPGTVISAFTGPATGTNSIQAGRGISEKEAKRAAAPIQNIFGRMESPQRRGERKGMKFGVGSGRIWGAEG